MYLFLADPLEDSYEGLVHSQVHLQHLTSVPCQVHLETPPLTSVPCQVHLLSLPLFSVASYVVTLRRNHPHIAFVSNLVKRKERFVIFKNSVIPSSVFIY